MTRSTSLLKAALIVAASTTLLDLSPGNGSARGQMPPAPKVDWSAIDWEDERSPAGTYYQLNTGTGLWEVDPVQDLEGNQAREESGEEWWFGHTNVKVNGEIVGYATAGYGGWANCYYTGLGCFPFNNPPTDGSLNATYDPSELEQPGLTKGTTRAVVAFYNLKGELQWYTFLLPGLAYNVIQDMNGDLVVVGQAYSNVEVAEDMGDIPILYNGEIGQDLSMEPCSTALHPDPVFARHGFIAKLKLDGTLDWNHLYGAQDDLAAGWNYESLFEDVIELPVGGQPTYLAMGRAKGEAVAVPPTVGEYPFMVRTAADGSLLDKRWYNASAPEWANTNVPVIDPPTSLTGWFSAVAKHPVTDQVFVAGWYRQNPPLTNHCFVFGMDPNDPFTPIWSHYSGDLNDDIVSLGGHLTDLQNYSTGIDVIEDANGGFHVVWPTLANYPNLPNNKIFAGKSVAQLLIHGFDLNGGYDWTTDLGEVRAYDLQADVTQTSDGKFAVVSTKWATGYSENGTKFGWNELPTDAQQCLTDHFSASAPGGLTVDWDCTNPPCTDTDPERYFAYWNTDAFVAKLDPVDGAMDWCTQWDADQTAEFECTPADLRNQECMYKITEAPDGGLVVSGNTSHNFDDYYLAKLHRDCQSFITYDPVVFAAPDHIYELQQNEVWTTPKVVHGIIRIPAGLSLTIEATTIQFADSRLQEFPTRIEVEAGGKLLVSNSAVLTSIAACPGSMWDGILVKGGNQSQDGNNFADQGYALVSASTIENARTAIITNNQFLDGDDLAAYQLQFAGGGVVRTRNAIFRNNKRDVVMGPYENHNPNDFGEVRVNRSYFRDTDFEVIAQLNDASMPREHISLYGVRNIPILGCRFQGNHYLPDPLLPITQDAGTGILSVGSSFQVADFCPVLVPYGTPCPTPIASSFDKLARGVQVEGLTDDKTFSVDNAAFTGCPRSIRMDAVRNAAITNNTIDVVDWASTDVLATPYGVYSDECTGYEIEDNELTVTTGTDQALTGMVIRNSGPENNRVYNNRFDGFDFENSTALIVEGENADANNSYLTGLEVRCNEFGRNGPKNAFDVALTATDPTVRKNQGALFSLPNDYTAPAGNLFSEHTVADDPESDWHVANTSPLQVRYYHHDGGISDPWVPEFFDADYLTPQLALGIWPPDRSQACPSNQRSRERERSSMENESTQQDALLMDSEVAYDATLDNGDTYTLIDFVGDPSKTSAQVRNALQSVAPNVSIPVWEVAFSRSPFMNEWNLTQALLSNSPLQPEVMKLCYESELSNFYYNLVASAQNGVNPLDVLESDISTYASGKAEDLTDLGRWSWLDSTNVDSAITLLKNWHDQLPADNGAAVLAGYYNATGDMAALYTLAYALENSSSLSQIYGLLKRYAAEQQSAGWLSPTAATKGWLQTLGQDREVIGSARAGTWLHALGSEPLEEIIVLPEPPQRRTEAAQRVRNHTQEAPMLEVYPNPTEGLAYLVCNVPEGGALSVITVYDAEGRLQKEVRLGSGMAVVEIDLSGFAAGLYTASLSLDGVRVGQSKVAVQ